VQHLLYAIRSETIRFEPGSGADHQAPAANFSLASVYASILPHASLFMVLFQISAKVPGRSWPTRLTFQGMLQVRPLDCIDDRLCGVVETLVLVAWGGWCEAGSRLAQQADNAAAASAAAEESLQAETASAWAARRERCRRCRSERAL